MTVYSNERTFRCNANASVITPSGDYPYGVVVHMTVDFLDRDYQRTIKNDAHARVEVFSRYPVYHRHRGTFEDFFIYRNTRELYAQMKFHYYGNTSYESQSKSYASQITAIGEIIPFENNPNYIGASYSGGTWRDGTIEYESFSFEPELAPFSQIYMIGPWCTNEDNPITPSTQGGNFAMRYVCNDYILPTELKCDTFGWHEPDDYVDRTYNVVDVNNPTFETPTDWYEFCMRLV